MENIPTFYGGKLSYGSDIDSCRYVILLHLSPAIHDLFPLPRFLSPEAIEMDEFVRKLNASFVRDMAST